MRLRPFALALSGVLSCLFLFLPVGFEPAALAVVKGELVSASHPANAAVVRVLAVSRLQRCDRGGCRNFRITNFCTGTVVDRRTVLTAAHCLTDPGMESVGVVFFPGDERREVTVPARSWRAHPSFRREAGGREGICVVRPDQPGACFGTDVGVVRLGAALPSGVSPLRRAPAGMDPSPGEQLTIFGYGLTDPARRTGEGRLRSGQVLYTGVRVQDQAIVGHGPRRTMFCVGDSGGPAFVTRGGQLLLWGIMASVSNPPCRAMGSVVRLNSVNGWVDRVSDVPGMRPGLS